MNIENLILAIYDESNDEANSEEHRNLLTEILQNFAWRERFETIHDMMEEIEEKGFF